MHILKIIPCLPEPLPEITFDVFEKVEMTVVKVLACGKVKKSEKLLKFQLDDGTGTPRQILSGIAKYYEPEELVGKTLGNMESVCYQGKCSRCILDSERKENRY